MARPHQRRPQAAAAGMVGHVQRGREVLFAPRHDKPVGALFEGQRGLYPCAFSVVDDAQQPHRPGIDVAHQRANRVDGAHAGIGVRGPGQRDLDPVRGRGRRRQAAERFERRLHGHRRAPGGAVVGRDAGTYQAGGVLVAAVEIRPDQHPGRHAADPRPAQRRGAGRAGIGRRAHPAPLQRLVLRADNPDRAKVVVGDPGPQRGLVIVAGVDRAVHRALAAVEQPVPEQEVVAIGAQPGGGVADMAPAHHVQPRSWQRRDPWIDVGAGVDMAVRGQGIGDRAPGRAAIGGAQLAQAILRVGGIDGAHSLDIVAERAEAGAVVVVPGDHRRVRIGAVVQPETVAQFMSGDALHLDLAGARVARHEVPGRAVAIAAVEHDNELVIPAEGGRQPGFGGVVQAIHRDDQFAGVGIGLRRVAVELESQIDAGDGLPSRVGVDDAVGEGALPTRVDALGDEGIPVDPDARPRTGRVPLSVCHDLLLKYRGSLRATGRNRHLRRPRPT